MCSQEVVLSFIARQQGSFRACQKLDVLGFVQKKGSSVADVPGLEFCSFHTISLRLSAVCLSETVEPAPKLNPGKYCRKNLTKTQAKQSIYLFLLLPALNINGFS